MNSSSFFASELCGLAMLAGLSVRGDAVTDWSAHLDEAVFATAQPVPAQPRQVKRVLRVKAAENCTRSRIKDS